MGIFRSREDSIADSSNLRERDVIAAAIVGDLQAAVEHFAQIACDRKPASVWAWLGRRAGFAS